MNKRAQVTIFIIIGLIIIFALLVLSLLGVFDIIGTNPSGKLNVEICIEDSVKQAISEIGLTAGFANVDDVFSYNDKGDKIPYLCYSDKYYTACMIQKPFLIQHFEEQLAEKIKNSVAVCYANSVSELQRKGYEVVAGNPTFSVSVVPEAIMVNLNAPTSISKETTATTRVSNFKFRFNSPIYDMMILATSIMQGEITDGDVSTDLMMVTTNSYNIQKDKKADGTKIYQIQEINSGEKFRFASRSYVYPAGYGLSEGVYEPGYLQK